MAQYGEVVMDDEHALSTLDVHFAMTLGCSPADLRRPGWTIVTTRDEGDPMALLFGRRTLLSLLIPNAPAGTAQRRRTGVARVAPEIREEASELLRALPPQMAYEPDALSLLDHLAHRAAPECTPLLAEAHTHVRYTTATGFVPYIGPWLDWIEPLDESAELEASALNLLAQHGAGVWVVRSQGSVISYAGVRTLSPHVSDITVRTDAEPHRGHGLARAVTSRATRAVLASERLPIFRHRATHGAAARVAESLGYRLYAHAVEYVAPAR
jgi:RimJ/RimL family protein N-acetyltransferase